MRDVVVGCANGRVRCKGLPQACSKLSAPVLFTSLEFAWFFLIVFPIYWLLRKTFYRLGLLLAASVWFYSSWNSSLALVLVVSTTLDCWLAARMQAHVSERHRRFLLRLSLVMNLGLLGLFKYAEFLAANLVAALNWTGLTRWDAPLLFLPNPIGISFYTFEAISYSVDVYRGRVAAERRWSHLLLFITFFPHVVAGPIVRARAMLPQIGRHVRWSWTRCELGVSLFCLGLFKKLAIADQAALLVDAVFARPAAYSSEAVGAAVLAYSVQLYCDFSGYTDMALGLAHLFGYRLAPNFDMPYLSRNVSEFWRRWHISLSSWLRDYLYIPLGGNARGVLRTNLNLLTTMLLGGLWHGASWNFAIWGLLHGLYLMVHRAYRGLLKRLDLRLAHPLWAVASWALCFTSVTLAWVFFRADSLDSAVTILCQVFGGNSGAPMPMASSLFAFLIGCLVCGHYLGATQRVRLARLPGPVRGAGYALLVMGAWVLNPRTAAPFVYFQF